MRVVHTLVLAGLWLSGAQAASAAHSIVRFSDFATLRWTNGVPEGWATWSPRGEIAPRFSVDSQVSRSGHGSLRIDADGDAAAFGAWRRRVEGIVGRRTYRFSAWYRAQSVAWERRSITARLEWQDEEGKWVRAPDFAIDTSKVGEWTKVEHFAAVPENTRSLVIDLSLGCTPNGTVWWDDIELIDDPAPPRRIIRAATVLHRPRGTQSAEESVREFCALVERAALQHPDIVCLPEGITVVGNGKTYADVSEPVPGPTTKRLGELARKLNSYLVAGLYERTNRVIYNTAVLIGRRGELVGTYRKTHLPREEWEAGLTHGGSYPVFQTDFGKVGLIVCWDVQFPEPARAMALKGAEVLLLPIWGGSEILAKARAIENHVFLVSSSYDMRSFILDPTGQVLAEATRTEPIAAADLELDQRIIQPWLGDMKNRTWKERRPDIPVQEPESTAAEK